ncbi:hypothetical protein [Roseovarius pelagicus]|uniref:Copper chaperone NosL n=1 Tax=Roseovarius pelagicus TaxID=2980108 RepID=A0ABY6DAN0_9RHOB|nr:hypothetical protein [Roseovarius pelagicus]UXX83219.1 hypothetical protein N7U68_19490 [Roseovarius pelagicus]
MRLIAFILLANLMVLVSSPHFDAAGMSMHECPSCPEAMVEMQEAEAGKMHQGPSCADMSLCAPMALISDAFSQRDGEYLGHRHAWPDAYKGASIRLALDLPPPRA